MATTIDPAWRMPEAVWERGQDLLPVRKSRKTNPGRKPLEWRPVLDGIFYVLRTGSVDDSSAGKINPKTTWPCSTLPARSSPSAPRAFWDRLLIACIGRGYLLPQPRDLRPGSSSRLTPLL